jgi:hypothetical protein
MALSTPASYRSDSFRSMNDSHKRRGSMLLTSLCVSWMVTILQPLASATLPTPKLKPVPLCRALERIEPGDQIPVVVSGIYAINYLYDPAEPECRLNVKPRTCVEFSEGLRRPSDFETLHRESLRVYATFSGTLHGSELDPQVEDSTIPFPARLAAVHSYCANFHPTKLVVESILDFKPVPKKVPWEHKSTYGKVTSQPYPIEMELPTYPRVAINLRAEGSVILSVEVIDGGVAVAEVQFGDPELAKEAVANVQTWRFSSGVNTRLTVEYEFRLEKRSASQGANPSLDMRLPSYIRVTGPSRGW